MSEYNQYSLQSIIGKVKSRVSSILPDRLSKWFSPSTPTTPNESLNGNATVRRRRRRIATSLEDDEEEDDELDDEDDEEGEEDEEDELENDTVHAAAPHRGNNRSPQASNAPNATQIVSKHAAGDQTNNHALSAMRRNRSPCALTEQPPVKRSRVGANLTAAVQDTPPSFMQRQPIHSSTPAIGNFNPRGVAGALRNQVVAASGVAVESNIDFSYNTLYGDRPINSRDVNSGLLPMVPTSAAASLQTENATETRALNTGSLSSRRMLNLPVLSQTSAKSDYISRTAHLRRKKLCSIQQSDQLPDPVTLPQRTSTTIYEIPENTEAAQSQEGLLGAGQDQNANDIQHTTVTASHLPNNTGYFKRQKLTNGNDNGLDANANQALARDSISQGSDIARLPIRSTEGTSNLEHMPGGRVSGIYNMSAPNSRSASRTSSFGNGLNFYSHLEGRKSLFGSAGQSTGVAVTGGRSLVHSTLSLTSLNRRQINSPLYGSTSALSDSRLLNTFSPFYKGRTTYGGAAAYSRPKLSENASAAAHPRLLPTIMRPASTSAYTADDEVALKNTTGLSSTTQRMLDLLQDFNSPVGDARKMAGNLSATQPQAQSLGQSRRFNEQDLNAARSMRLSKVRNPYMRPTVTLNAKGPTAGPPVRELQVPTMSHILHMKRMQDTMQRSRQIAAKVSANELPNQATQPAATATEYSLPNNQDPKENKQQQHTNKIRTKVGPNARQKDDPSSDLPPPPVNLPNIAFPQIQNLPKFDIGFKPLGAAASIGEGAKTTNTTTPAFKLNSAVASSAQLPITSTSGQTATKTTTLPTVELQTTANNKTTNADTAMKFVFSAPRFVTVSSATDANADVPAPSVNFKFSVPIPVSADTFKTALESAKSSTTTRTDAKQAASATPQLKTGSVLDALKQNPFVLPKAPKIAGTSTGTASSTISSANDSTKNSSSTNSGTSSLASLTQFKKSAGEWECDVCMVRNKADCVKCPACETARPGTATAPTTTPVAATPNLTPFGFSAASSFGDAFKPKQNMWECPSCMIRNKNEAEECVACTTKKPGSANASADKTAAFSFTPVTAKADESFQKLASAQKAATWECEACMTRNDANKVKCACCEQPKPGTLTVPDDVPPFSFGATAAAKFSFGFGTATNAAKEEELRKAANTTTQKTETAGDNKAESEAAKPAITVGSFSFGFKPTGAAAADNVKQLETSGECSKPAETATTTTTPFTGFKFGAEATTATASSANSTSTTTTAITVASSTAASTTSVKPVFSFGAPAITGKPTEEPSTSCSDLVKKTANDTPGSTAAKFSFGASSSLANAASTTAQPSSSVGLAFSFGAPKTTVVTSTASTTVTSAQSTLGGFAFKPSTSTMTAATTVAETSITGTPPSKPLFTFGGAATSGASAFKSPATTAASSTPPKPSGFSFGAAAAAVPPTASKSLFAVPAKSAGTKREAPDSDAAPAAKNIFGSFSGSPASAPKAGETNATAPFGAASSASKPISSVGAFVFGGGNNAASSSAAANTSTTTSTGMGANASWPKNNFAFGSSASATNATAADATKPAFGGFGASTATGPAATSVNSIFGNVNANSVGGSPSSNKPAAGIFGSAASAAPVFGFGSGVASGNSDTGSSNPFGAVTGSSNAVPASNLFGAASANAGGAAATSTPAFGSGTSIFGAAGSLQTPANPPSFGTASTGSTNSFGGFGQSTAPTAGSSVTDGASAPKKSESLFSFGASTGGAAGGATGSSGLQPGSGGFNFGGSAKPAFSFGGATTTPNFNFTGQSTAETAKATTQPFQFGSVSATPTLPTTFNFGGGAQENTNAPFQFNANAAQPLSSNIFAPTPTAGTPASQQARRKIRAPMRRLPPR